MMEEKNTALPETAPPPTWPARVRGILHGPVLIGLVAALIAIALSVFGMVRNPDATPLNVRSLLLVIVLAGGSWGLIAWAIATAAVEAGKDDVN
ncbi:MAG: hypothetical protein M1482_15260 [Chloroflexi bacterium]|nr:hypothetical protein [Chloroflexota bacterium]